MVIVKEGKFSTGLSFSSEVPFSTSGLYMYFFPPPFPILFGHQITNFFPRIPFLNNLTVSFKLYCK